MERECIYLYFCTNIHPNRDMRAARGNHWNYCACSYVMVHKHIHIFGRLRNLKAKVKLLIHREYNKVFWKLTQGNILNTP